MEHARSQCAPESARIPTIKAVHVLSSGWAEQHKEHRYGTSKPQLWWILTSRSWVKASINYFLIEHCDDPVLFNATKEVEHAMNVAAQT